MENSASRFGLMVLTAAFVMAPTLVHAQSVALPDPASLSKMSAADAEKYFTITESETVELTKPVARKQIEKAPKLSLDLNYGRDRKLVGTGQVPGGQIPGIVFPGGVGGGFPTQVGSGLDIGSIIQTGTEIWQIIVDNKPVDTEQYSSISVIPEAAQVWTDLSNWGIPTTRIFRTTYKNIFRMNVIDFTYRITYTMGGQFDGKGKYLSRISIDPSQVKIAWAYSLSVTAEVNNPMNAGSSEDPVAAAEIHVNWNIDTALKHFGTSSIFYVRGDGLFKDLTNGTIR